jgi:hypothetical protein
MGGIAITTDELSISIYKRLRDVGFSKSYIQSVAALPTWWDDKLWENPASRAEGFMHLSRHLGIDIASMRDSHSTIRLKDFGVCKYKKQAGTTDDDLLLARMIATRAPQLATLAIDSPIVIVPSTSALSRLNFRVAETVDF